jgi:hypothetical protein
MLTLSCVRLQNLLIGSCRVQTKLWVSTQSHTRPTVGFGGASPIQPRVRSLAPKVIFSVGVRTKLDILWTLIPVGIEDRESIFVLIEPS